MTACRCPRPHSATHARQLGDCAACGRRLGDWSPTTERVDEFLDKLEEYVQIGAPWASRSVPYLREQVHAREQAGRRQFDHAFLNRDNAAEALEEGADLVLYMILEGLRLVRSGDREDVEPSLLLASFHGALAYAAVQQAIAVRNGTPGHRVNE